MLLSRDLVCRACSAAWSSLASSPRDRRASPVTYTKDVAPLLADRCGMCHHPGGSAPFSLLTYADAKRHADADRRGHREPLHAAVEGGSGRRSVRRPASAERRRDRDCCSAGRTPARRRAIRAESAAAAQPWTDGWQLGTPDLVVTLPQPYTLPAGGHRRLPHLRACRFRSSRARFVRGLEFRPGNPQVVHHANIRIDRDAGVARARRRRSGARLRRADRALGDLSRRPLPRLDAGPGRAAAAEAISRGASSRTPISSSSCTCSRAASAEPVAPSIGFYFSDEPPTRTPAMLRLGRQNIDIPAGRRALHRHRFVHAAGRRRGRSGAAARALPRARRARRGDAARRHRRRPLIDIADWDFRWQHVYRFVTPLRLPKGTTVVDALHLRQLRGEPAQPAAAAGARALGPAIGGRDGRPVDPGADARRPRSRRAQPRLPAEGRRRRRARATKSRSRSTRPTPALHDDVALLYLELGRERPARSRTSRRRSR